MYWNGTFVQSNGSRLLVLQKEWYQIHEKLSNLFFNFILSTPRFYTRSFHTLLMFCSSIKLSLHPMSFVFCSWYFSHDICGCFTLSSIFLRSMSRLFVSRFVFCFLFFKHIECLSTVWTLLEASYGLQLLILNYDQICMNENECN